MRAASYPTSDFKNRSPKDEEMQQRAGDDDLRTQTVSTILGT
jgi:hypothetical protein